MVSRQDGTQRRRLSPWRVRASKPAWSPDGRRIAFTRQSAAGRLESVLVGLEGAPARVLDADGTGDGFPVPPGWSPGGSEIALGRTVAGENRVEVVAVRVEGSGIRVLVSDGGISPDWSPDGTSIAIVRRSGLAPEVITLATGVRRALPPTEGPGAEPRWSPDGSLLLTDFPVRVREVADGRTRLVTGIGVDPTWLPDGRVLFRTPFGADLVVSGVDGSGRRPVLRAFQRELRRAGLEAFGAPSLQPSVSGP